MKISHHQYSLCAIICQLYQLSHIDFLFFKYFQFCQFRVAYLSGVASLADSAGQPSVAARWLARPIPALPASLKFDPPAQHHQPPTLLYISCIARRSCLPRPSPPAQPQAPTPSLKISTAPRRAAGLLYATLASAIFIGVSDLHAPPMPGKVQGRHEKAPVRQLNANLSSWLPAKECRRQTH